MHLPERWRHCCVYAPPPVKQGQKTVAAYTFEATLAPAKPTSHEPSCEPQVLQGVSKALAMPCLKAIIFLTYTCITLIFIDLATLANGWMPGSEISCKAMR